MLEKALTAPERPAEQRMIVGNHKTIMRRIAKFDPSLRAPPASMISSSLSRHGCFDMAQKGRVGPLR